MTGDKKVKNIVVLNNITLESTEVATQVATGRIIIDTFYSTILNLNVKYTTGAGETANNAYFKVWGYIGSKSEETGFPYNSTNNASIAEDVDNWIQLGTVEYTAGVGTFVPITFKIAGAAAATTYSGHFRTDITFSKIRISAYEDGVTTNKGTLTVVASIQ